MINFKNINGVKIVSIKKFACFLFNENKFLSLVIFYEVFTTIVYILSGIDYRIPCIYTLIFGNKCYGCGLSESFSELIQFNFQKAIQINFLIIPFIVVVIFYTIKNYILFLKK